MYALALGFSVELVISQQHESQRTNYNSLIKSHTPSITHKSSLHGSTLHSSRRELTWTAEFSLPLLFSLTELTTAHTKSSVNTFGSFSTTNLPRLLPTENSLKLNAISPINPWSDTQKNTVSCYCWCHTLQWRHRGHLTSPHSCAIQAFTAVTRCGSARHSRARFGTEKTLLHSSLVA
jgi:hypothetical protein